MGPVVFHEEIEVKFFTGADFNGENKGSVFKSAPGKREMISSLKRIFQKASFQDVESDLVRLRIILLQNKFLCLRGGIFNSEAIPVRLLAISQIKIVRS